MSDIPSILPPNAQAVELHLEQLSSRLIGLSDPVSALWDAESCPPHLLPWLAWAFSVEVWDKSWPETFKRQIVVDAVRVHRQKGTVGAVRRALSGIGFNVEIREWFETGGAPHTFSIDAFGADVFAAGLQISPALLSLATRLIENVKPERSHFDLRIGESFSTECGIRVGAVCRSVHQASHDPAPRTRLALASQTFRAAARCLVLSKFTHSIQGRPN